MKLKAEAPKGLLDRAHSQPKFQLARYDPAEDVSLFISHYWAVSWNLAGQEPFDSESLPSPNIHMVMQRDKSGIFGIPRGKFVRRLEGTDRAFGVSFRPGGFYPLVRVPAWRFTDRSTGLEEVLGAAGLTLEAAMLATEDHGGLIALAEAFVRGRGPRPDAAIEVVNYAVDCIAANRGITKVDDVAREAGTSRRQLERLFSRYVGVSPKWVIQRYRLFEAADRLAAEPGVDAARLARELGYFDQAHFIKDFKAMVGSSPAEYARKAS
ncbi:MAG TPA: helix-turn-helix domain-containing protein [Chloroflexota bacterium]|nr:helix-turn-helix domain-containing protein [Chloroflexota bacterium]